MIETANYSEGVLSQYVEMPGQPTRGLLHSDALTSVERLRFDAATQQLELTIELSDPVFFTRGFDPVSARYAPSSLEIARPQPEMSKSFWTVIVPMWPAVSFVVSRATSIPAAWSIVCVARPTA